MAEKNIRSRIILKHDIEDNWKLATGFIPMVGEVVIYDKDESHQYQRKRRERIDLIINFCFHFPFFDAF